MRLKLSVTIVIWFNLIVFWSVYRTWQWVSKSSKVTVQHWIVRSQQSVQPANCSRSMSWQNPHKYRRTQWPDIRRRKVVGSDKNMFPINYFSSLVQLKTLKKRLAIDEDCREKYNFTIKDDLNKGYAIKVSNAHKFEKPSDKEWYLPQHPVAK